MDCNYDNRSSFKSFPFEVKTEKKFLLHPATTVQIEGNLTNPIRGDCRIALCDASNPSQPFVNPVTWVIEDGVTGRIGDSVASGNASAVCPILHSITVTNVFRSAATFLVLGENNSYLALNSKTILQRPTAHRLID
jgi:hypothetical protein